VSSQNPGAVAPPLVGFNPTLVPQGDGSFLVKAGKPVVKLSLRDAAKRSGLSRSTLYRLYESGLVKGERPSPRKIFVYADSLQEHLSKCQDAEYWDQSDRRRSYAMALKPQSKRSRPRHQTG
jgi:hypothetical protein